MEGIIIAANEKNYYILYKNDIIHSYTEKPCFNVYSSFSKKVLTPWEGNSSGVWKYSLRLYNSKKAKSFSHSEQNELFNVAKNDKDCYKNFKHITLGKQFCYSQWIIAYSDDCEKLMEGLK